jgi:hypothetical protein
MLRIATAERRARLAVRHHVAPKERIDDVVEIARDLVCLHSSDPATVYLSIWARVEEPTPEAVDRALYEDRRLIRMLAMRRTMFVAPIEDAPILDAAASRGVAVRERRRNEEILAIAGIKDARRWMRTAEKETLAALRRLGEATAQELSKEVPHLQVKARVNVGKKYEGEIGMASRTVLLLALEGKLTRARPRGSWISSQYRWTPIEHWFGRSLPDMGQEQAMTELVRRWLARFGPGTEADIRWWSGRPARDVRAALKALEAVEVHLEGSAGFVLADDLDPTTSPGSWAALLPSLDPTTMGWQSRDWYLGPHKAQLFDTNGNAGPTIWVDGRIVGGWAIRPGGEIVTKLLEDVGRDHVKAIETEVERLTRVLASVAVVPRFPTPLYRELVG